MGDKEEEERRRGWLQERGWLSAEAAYNPVRARRWCDFPFCFFLTISLERVVFFPCTAPSSSFSSSSLYSSCVSGWAREKAEGVGEENAPANRYCKMVLLSRFEEVTRQGAQCCTCVMGARILSLIYDRDCIHRVKLVNPM